MYSSNVFLLYSSDVFVKCILCILHCILSQACRGVSEAEEMLVTQMSNVFFKCISSVFLKCICVFCLFYCILSKACRGVSEAEEMLVTQMSNVARNEIASPPPHWQNILNVYQIFIKCQFIKHFYYYLSDIIK